MNIQKLTTHPFSDRAYSFLKKGFTLLELTVVLVVLLTLIGVGFSSFNGYNNWKKAAEAGTRLRAVYTAQVTYLSEHPTVEVENLAMTDIIPYLASGGGFLTSAIPDPVDLKEIDIFIVDLNEGKLQIKVDKSPPYITGDYDPSGDPDDGQWDVGN
jgi:prepilin-type N-terminal cleavage/methylation domain-containing protein